MQLPSGQGYYGQKRIHLHLSRLRSCIDYHRSTTVTSNFPPGHQHPPPGLHCHSPYHDPRLEWRLPCRRAREAPFMEQVDGLDGYAPTRHSCDCPSRLQLRPLVMLRFDIDHALTHWQVSTMTPSTDGSLCALVRTDNIHPLSALATVHHDGRSFQPRPSRLRYRPPAMRTCTLRHRPPAMHTFVLRH